MLQLSIAWALLLISLNCFSADVAAETSTDSYGGKIMMNGQKLDDFKNFEKTWPLVTVRFRKDTSEMRFTYANKAAWKTLKAGQINYPDGAVFAKIGFITNEDPSFASSAVPSGVRRYQFMIRDQKKYKDTQGWGYLLFDTDGKTYPENPSVQVKACAACHNLVSDRGYVFSQPLSLSPQEKNWPPKSPFSSIKFETVKVTELPEALTKNISPKITEARILRGELSKYLFQGTLEEIKPVLTKEAFKSKMPALLLSDDKLRFSIVFENTNDTSCPVNEVPMMSIMTKAPSQKAPSEVMLNIFCYKNIE